MLLLSVANLPQLKAQVTSFQSVNSPGGDLGLG